MVRPDTISERDVLCNSWSKPGYVPIVAQSIGQLIRVVIIAEVSELDFGPALRYGSHGSMRIVTRLVGTTLRAAG